MYSMLFLFGALSILFYSRCLQDHSFDNRLGYAVATMAMLLTHPYGSLVLLGQLLHLAARLARTSDREGFRRWLGTETLTVVPLVPWLGLVAFKRYFLGTATETRWLSTVSLNELKNVGFAYVGVPVNYPILNI